MPADGNQHRKGEAPVSIMRTSVPEAKTARNYLNEGLELSRAGKHSESLRASYKALELKPTILLTTTSVERNDLGQWDEAIKAGKQAVRRNPANQPASNNLAWAIKHKAASAQSGAEKGSPVEKQKL